MQDLSNRQQLNIILWYLFVWKRYAKFKENLAKGYNHKWAYKEAIDHKKQ